MLTLKLSSLGPIHTSCCCRAELIIIRCGTSTAFSVFDSYVEPNLSNVMTNQAKMSFISRKWTVAIKGKIQFCLIFQIKKFDRNETLVLQLRNESINLHGAAC